MTTLFSKNCQVITTSDHCSPSWIFHRRWCRTGSSNTSPFVALSRTVLKVRWSSTTSSTC